MHRTEPLVSVVIPTWRRPALLARCLQALCAQRLPPQSYEIIVADDGCEARIERLVALMASRHPAHALRYVAVSGTQGPSGARNAGWRRAASAVIAFTDDDTVPDPHWLREGCAALARQPECCAVAGAVEVPLPPRPTDHERDTGGLAQAEFVTANCFVRREALRRIGGFDERFTRAWREDSDLQFRLMNEVCPVGRAPRAVVVHPVRPAAWGSSIAAQAKVYYDALLYKKHPRLYRQRIRRTPPWHYYVAVLALLAAPVALLAGAPRVAAGAGLLWLALTVSFCLRRLRGTALTPAHVAEMALTSVLIPPLSLFWRLRGALAFRVVFL
ncbi:glycosyltransferase family 2 protein [Cupriavidus sp. L7L]|uniref:glycosyltransferase family 2 protein n=1 Tax=Cupriavidus sp. L7L TaxID=2546443 RepID=UPI0010560E6C|nr:glycosyltransferase family A protein [Cupriavidus sp. L7L]TDF66119.1 glycosyltransferase family 2 protein [Cupriavidus sp. L7L]